MYLDWSKVYIDRVRIDFSASAVVGDPVYLATLKFGPMYYSMTRKLIPDAFVNRKLKIGQVIEIVLIS